MNAKPVIKILLFSSLSFLLLLTAFLWLYFNHPEYLGLHHLSTSDSLSSPRDSIHIYVQQRDSLQRILENTTDSLMQLLSECYNTVSSLTQAKDSLKQQIIRYQQKDSLENLQRIRHLDSILTQTKQKFAEIYNQAAPETVAKILENLDDKEAAELLLLMDRKQAAQVLSAMDPERAARIVVLSIVPTER